MSDREAKLKIGVDASEMGEAAKETGKLTDSIKKLGDSGEGAAGDLKKTATALETVEAAGEGVTGTAREAAGALEGVGASAQESAAATASGALGAAQALDGVTIAAGEERAAIEAAGATAVDSAGDATSAIDKMAAAEQEAAANARNLAEETAKVGNSTDQFRNGVEQIEKMGAALRSNEYSLEVQRAGISALVQETEKLLRKQVESGLEGKEGANIAGDALLRLKARLADVNAEITEQVTRLRTIGSEGEGAFDSAAASVLNFEATAEKATSRVNESWQQYQDNLAITPGQLRLTAQAVAAVEIAIVQAGERGQAVTIEQLATYEKLQNQLRELTAQANALTNASKDNAVGLKQTGAQVAGLTSGVQQLTAMLGPNAARIGMVVGNVGQLGNVMEGLDASVKALDLNTISATGGLAKMGGQLGLVAIVAAVAAKAGLELSQTNAQNAESTENLWKSTKKLASELGTNLSDALGGLQGAMQSVVIATDDVVLNAAELGTTAEESARATRGLEHAMDELYVANRAGASGVKLFNVALRDGLSVQQAQSLSLKNAAEVLKFYESSRRAGAEGEALWRRILVESQGDTAKMTELIASNTNQMETWIKVTDAQTEAQKENNAANREAVNIALMKADTTSRLLTAEEQNVQRLSTGRRQLEQAVNGSTAGINREIEALRKLLPESARNAETLRDYAAGLSAALANVEGLSGGERARAEALIELIGRGDELTLAERRFADALAASIVAGDKKFLTLQSLAEGTSALKEATDALVAATQAEASAQDEGTTAIHKAVDAAEKLLASNTPLEAAERLRLSTIVELGKQVGDLVAWQETLNAKTREGAAAQGQAAEAEHGIYLVKSASADRLQDEIDLRAEIIKSLSLEKSATDAAAESSTKAQAIQKTAHGVYTNLVDDQTKVADATKAAGDAAEEAAGKFGGVLATRLADGRIAIINIGQSAKETSDNLSHLGNRAEAAGPAVDRAFDSFSAGSTKLDSVMDKMRQLEQLFGAIEGRTERITANVDSMNAAIERSGEVATRAAGYGTLTAPE